MFVKNNLPMGIYSRRLIAWVGEETSMVSSMKEFYQIGPITVDHIFKVSMKQFENERHSLCFVKNKYLLTQIKRIKI